MLSFLVYRNYVYYLIPYNPLKEYYSEASPYSIGGTLFTNERDYDISTNEYKTEKNNETIFQYFKELKLVPLSRNGYKEEQALIKSSENVVYLLRFRDYGALHINEIYLDNPTVIRIASHDINGFPNGYYKIVNNEFDYTYVNNLIKGEKD